MFIEFYGAANEVTGSLHRVSVAGTDVLLDCGLVQGHRAEANRFNRELPGWATGAHTLVLSHAHLDHSGNIPTLVKRGFAGNVFCTPPTRDLCSVMLRDSAMLQEQDARFLNKRFRREGVSDHIEALYTVADAQAAVTRMISLPFYRPLTIAPGITLTLHNAGHVLGSALVQLQLVEQGRRVNLLYTGDLGREQLPLLSPPDLIDDIDFLITESTYGDRIHGDITTLDDRLAHIVNTTIGRGGRVLIPTFALERAQEVLFALERLHDRGKVEHVPIYIDSPLAIAITEIYKLHPESLADDVRERILNRDDPFSPPGLRYVSDIDSSRRLQDSGQPCIVIAGSGMCEGGRILHHFSRGLSEPQNSVVLVGFQARHTLGRRLQEGRKRVKVFGIERDVRAEIHVLDGLSAHADQDGLVDFTREIARRGRLRNIALVHGEDEARLALTQRLQADGLPPVIQSARGLRIDL